MVRYVSMGRLRYFCTFCPALVVCAAKEADGLVLAGQAAYNREQATTAEDREQWALEEAEQDIRREDWANVGDTIKDACSGPGYKRVATWALLGNRALADCASQRLEGFLPDLNNPDA